MAFASLVLVALFLILYGIQGLGAPMGIVVPVVALIAGVVLLLQHLPANKPILGGSRRSVL